MYGKRHRLPSPMVAPREAKMKTVVLLHLSRLIFTNRNSRRLTAKCTAKSMQVTCQLPNAYISYMYIGWPMLSINQSTHSTTVEVKC